MKKLFTLLCFAAISLYATNLSAQSFEEGDGVLNVTIGIGNALYYGGGYNTSFPPLAVSYEVGMLDDLLDGNASIGVGGYLGFASYRRNYIYTGYSYNNLVIGPRGIFHYYLADKLDTYAGLMIGARISSTRYRRTTNEISRSSYGRTFVDTFIGGRYYFNERVAATAELGIGLAYLNLGAAFKLK